jgi:hypothetical protein
MQWGKREIGGVKYDLTHLDPFRVVVPAHDGGGELTARVRFGSHVFTLTWSDNYVEEFRIRDGTQSRCFCPIRYGHSLHLPGIVERGLAGRVLFDPQRTLVVLGNPPGVLSPYAVFFVMKRVVRQPYQIDVVVVSAHEHPRLKAKFGMPFPQLAAIVAARGPIPWPKK